MGVLPFCHTTSNTLGLGTSTPKEAKEYFAHIDKHRLPFTYVNDEDDAGIELAFSKKKVDERKEWLRSFVPGTFLDHDQSTVRYSDFIHKELILFSMADNVRSIPSVVDGFKPGQRKVQSCFLIRLFLFFKKKSPNGNSTMSLPASVPCAYSSPNPLFILLPGPLLLPQAQAQGRGQGGVSVPLTLVKCIHDSRVVEDGDVCERALPCGFSLN
jgi:hypothetical protein